MPELRVEKTKNQDEGIDEGRIEAFEPKSSPARDRTWILGSGNLRTIHCTTGPNVALGVRR